MKILLSPAKLLDLKTTKTIEKSTIPLFITQTIKLQNKYKKLTPNEISSLMNISQKLAHENWERNQKWNANPAKDESIQAILAFKGEVYRGLKMETIEDENLDYVENNILILSGLYGMLHPFDKIMPYRMEMGINFSYGKAKNLYEYWSNTITSYLNNNLQKEEFILNLASKEYTKVLNKKNMKNTIVDIDFKENRNGKLQNIMTFFKNARGKMTRYCIENQINNIDQVKLFNNDNYIFSEKLSSDNHLTFIR